MCDLYWHTKEAVFYYNVTMWWHDLPVYSYYILPVNIFISLCEWCDQNMLPMILVLVKPRKEQDH